MLLLLLAAHAQDRHTGQWLPHSPAPYSTLPASRTSTNRLQRNVKRLMEDWLHRSWVSLLVVLFVHVRLVYFRAVSKFHPEQINAFWTSHQHQHQHQHQNQESNPTFAASERPGSPKRWVGNWPVEINNKPGPFSTRTRVC